MKRNKLFSTITLFLFAFALTGFAQKQTKSFKETFNVNKDVEVEIEASNTEIDVTTWNKNQVLVEATIEIEGLTKEEAEKYFKNYKFEALGNKSKVKIYSRGGNRFPFNKNDFVVFDPNFKMPDIVIPDVKIPEITIPDFDFDFGSIVIPEIDMENLFLEIGDIDFDWDKFEKDGDKYFFRWKDSVRDITIRSKKDWEKFKKSKDYKEWKEEVKKNRVKMEKELKKAQLEVEKARKEFDSKMVQKEIEMAMKEAKKAIEKANVNEIVQEALKEARKSMKEVDSEELKKELAKLRENFNSFKYNFSFDDEENELIINDKKVKITKKIKIKVPKGATFDLNTRHSKIKLPDTNATGKVSYGSFDAVALNGGDLKVYSSPVNINRLVNTNLSLNNVTDATLASVAQCSLEGSSSDIKINEVVGDLVMDLSFGDLIIDKINTNIKNFELDLSQAGATVNLSGFKKKLDYDSDTLLKKKNDDRFTLKGSISLDTVDGKLKINGKYSDLTVILK